MGMSAARPRPVADRADHAAGDGAVERVGDRGLRLEPGGLGAEREDPVADEDLVEKAPADGVGRAAERRALKARHRGEAILDVADRDRARRRPCAQHRDRLRSSRRIGPGVVGAGYLP